jgi:hypothetical protein
VRLDGQPAESEPETASASGRPLMASIDLNEGIEHLFA